MATVGKLVSAAIAGCAKRVDSCYGSAIGGGRAVHADCCAVQSTSKAGGTGRLSVARRSDDAEALAG